MKAEVCVVGAGICGLSTAHFLRQKGHRVLVLEQAPRAGGVIRTRKLGGFLFDQGPNSTLNASRALQQIIEDLGLRERVRVAGKGAANRYIWRQGKLRLVPMNPAAFLRTDLLSWKGKFRTLKEVFVPPDPQSAGESVARFVERRLGREFLDYLIDPFVAGVYAGDPAHLSIKSAFRRVYELERQYGGLIRGFVAKRKAARAGANPDRTRAGLISFDAGMQVLSDALANSLKDSLWLNTRVLDIQPQSPGFCLGAVDHSGRRIELHCSQVVLATPAGISAQLLRKLFPPASHGLQQIPYASIAVVFTGYRETAIPGPLDGFGFLIPAVEGRRILGCIWSSSLFPGRAPEGYVALTTFVGGVRQPGLVHLDDHTLSNLVHHELTELLGLSARPDLVAIKKWEKAIPQYDLNHERRIRVIEQAEAAFPGLYLCGNYRKGISVGDCADYAAELAERISAACHTHEPQPA